MKFSCSLNEIDYVFNTSKGIQSDAKFHFFLSSKDKKRLQKGDMGYYQLHIEATKNDYVMSFEVHGLPLSHEPERQVTELEDFFESLLIFSKIENHFSLHESNFATPPWAQE